MENKISTNVIRRVKIIFFLRRSLNSLTFETSALIGAIVALIYLTSIPQIFENFTNVNGIHGFFRLTFSALTETEIIVQLVSTTFLFSLIFLAKDIFYRSNSLWAINRFQFRNKEEA